MLFAGSTFAQEQEENQEKPLKRYRIGLKAGIPNLVSPEVEIVTPLLDNRVSGFANFSGINNDFSDVELDASTFEIGGLIYLKPNAGSGLYAGLSYFRFDTEAIIQDVDFDDNTTGEGAAALDFNAVNAKIGLKAGRSVFFRTELGWSFASLPDEIVVTETGAGRSTTTESVEDDIDFLGNSGLPLFNIGFGVAF